MNYSDYFVVVVWGAAFIIVLMKLVNSLRLVKHRTAMIVERMGKYHVTLKPGLHILVPWIDKVTAILDLKEATIEVPPQECFTKDEIKVLVDGVIYISVIDPVKAAYGVTNFKWAAMQLAQTTTRSIIGKISLDKTFEEREYISATVIHALQQTQEQWGVLIHRYEIKNLQPPESVRVSMEKQVRAERERRAILAKSEGEKQSRVNRSEGIKVELINTSEGEKQKRINEAEGLASEIKSLADATAESINKVAQALQQENGQKAIELNIVEQYLQEVGKLGEHAREIICPMDLSSVRNTTKISKQISQLND